jgi:hypothetical protein
MAKDRARAQSEIFLHLEGLMMEEATPFIIVTDEAHTAAMRAFEHSLEEEGEQLPDGTWRLSVTQEEIDAIKPMMRPGETYSELLVRAAKAEHHDNDERNMASRPYVVAQRAKRLTGRMNRWTLSYVAAALSKTLSALFRLASPFRAG